MTVLALGTSLIAVSAALACHITAGAVWRRTVWQIGFVALMLLVLVALLWWHPLVWWMRGRLPVYMPRKEPMPSGQPTQTQIPFR